MIPKELWLQNIIDSLKEIGSAEFQEKGWVKNEIHDYCTFLETIVGLFSDANFEEFIDEHAKNFGLSNEQIKRLDEIRHALNHYVDEHSTDEKPEIIINDPEWHKIRKLAKEALNSLGIVHYLDPSKAIFKDSLLYAIDYIRDRKSQERVWINERRPNSNPFRELMDRFFKNAKAKEVIDKYREYEISEEQHAILKRLYDLLFAYKEKHENEVSLQVILDDPEWHRIQSLAADVVGIFQFKR